MSELALRHDNSTALATADDGGGNVFQRYAKKRTQRTIVGTLLKFSKGDYLAGSDNVRVAEGTKLIANIDELLIGWIKWEANKPVEQLMGKLTDGFQLANRKSLGDSDESLWETDDTGRPRDPWQETNYLLMKVPGGDKIYTFTASSRGGIGGVDALVMAYGDLMRSHPNQLPIIALKWGDYAHKIKSYGRIKFPVFEIVGWADKAEFDEALGKAHEAADRAAEADDDEIPF